MSLKLYEFNNGKGIEVFTVRQNNKLLAKARKTGSGHWLLRIYNASWLDARGRKANIFGIIDPSVMVLKNKRDVRREITALANQAGGR